MGAKERDTMMQIGQKTLSKGTPANVEELKGLLDELKVIAQDIIDDFEETRDNLSEKQGLLDKWEEDYGYKSDSWEGVLSSLDSFDIEDYLEEYDDGEIVQEYNFENAFNEIDNIWSEGE